jgi:hypothetical protein
MNMEKHTHSHIFLRILGGLFLILGGIALYYGPLEFYCLYLFSQNGPFFYEGFGVGSIWLALLLCHNLGYYIVASICLPLGAGTLSRSRWALTWSRVFFVVWLAGGITVFLMLLVFLPRFFTLSLPFQTLLARVLLGGFCLFLVGLVIPFGFFRWYGSCHVESFFTRYAQSPSWVHTLPLPILAFLVMCVGVFLGWHLLIFFHALFPLFGRVLVGRQGVYAIAGAIAVLPGLMYGIAKRYRWAWWGMFLYFSLLTLSSVLTLNAYDFRALYHQLRLPAREMAYLDQLTFLHDMKCGGIVGIPLFILLGGILNLKRYFKPTR